MSCLRTTDYDIQFKEKTEKGYVFFFVNIRQKGMNVKEQKKHFPQSSFPLENQQKADEMSPIEFKKITSMKFDLI